MTTAKGLAALKERIFRFLIRKCCPYVKSRPADDSLRVNISLEPSIGRPSDLAGGRIIPPQLQELSLSEQFDEFLQRDTLPIPPPGRREGYSSDRHIEYWVSGLNDYLTIVQALPDIDWAGVSLLDFGGATGRVARHFYAQSGCRRITIADVNINHVEWVVRHFPPNFVSVKTGPLPTLPFPDAEFNVVIAFSVFTHIDVFEYAWLCELRRVLKPDGILYATVQNDDTWAILPTTYVFKLLQWNEAFMAQYVPGSKLTEKIIVKYSEEEVYNCHVFHPNWHIRENWGRIFEVVDIVPTTHSYQSAAILRKRRS